MTHNNCAVCLSSDSFECEAISNGLGDRVRYNCEVCGCFLVSRSALSGSLSGGYEGLGLSLRASLSHQIRLNYETLSNSEELFLLTTDDIRKVIDEGTTLPSPSQQSMHALRYIGEEFGKTYQPIPRLPPHFHALIGAPNRRFSLKLVRDLIDREMIDAVDNISQDAPLEVAQLEPTLDGWQAFDKEKRGAFSSEYGFIALKFGDQELDAFLANHVKPRLARLGFRCVDLRDVSRAGVIDNILRSQIRDARFVLADLTHENQGAYWEAGYAEGLGKPVIYICEKSKFDNTNTHFDTNHCTTVMWEKNRPEAFVDSLAATIRRSIVE